jgi:arylsulfatase A-like enzyme
MWSMIVKKNMIIIFIVQPIIQIKISQKKENFGGIKWAQLDAEDDALADFHVAKWAASELLKKHDKPLFLAAGLFKPHLPWHVPKKYFDLYPIDKIVLPPYKEDDLEDMPEEGKKMSKNTHAQIQSETQWREAIQAYQATISYADAQIGIILDAYEKSPEKENTMIVLWGDHGWHLGEKHHWRKFALWEEATRSPLIWVVPNLTKPGSKCSKTIDFMSIYPTLAELNGLKTPTYVEGKSIKKLLVNPNAEWNIPALTTYKEGNHAVRSENYRYIRYAKGGEEFYDEKNDPYEWVNIINDKNILAQKNELSKLMPKTEKKGVGNNGGKAEE